MGTKHSLVLRSVLQVMRPLVRLLLCHGVTYPAVAGGAQERVCASRTGRTRAPGHGAHRQCAHLAQRCAPQGRARAAPARATAPRSRRADGQATELLGLAGEVVGRWMSDRAFRGRQGPARRLPKSGEGSFDALVASVSQDVRPRAMLDELLRLGVVSEGADGHRAARGRLHPAPGLCRDVRPAGRQPGRRCRRRRGQSAAGEQFLEQSIYVDQITAESALHLEQVAKKAWGQAFKRVMHEARMRFDADAVSVPADQRQHRARFGVYSLQRTPKGHDRDASLHTLDGHLARGDAGGGCGPGTGGTGTCND